MNKTIIYLLFICTIAFFNFNLANCQLIRKIPDYLIECYSNETFNGPQLPLTLQVFIDIIQKIESSSKSAINLRALTSSLLHRFKFDGIEFNKSINFKPGILPFSASGSQRAKNEIVNELVAGQANVFPDETLSLLERCALHRALSNSISEAESPVTDNMCAERPSERMFGNLVKERTCPTEQGVILTPSLGTVAPGPIIAGIAAALQHQNVPIKLMFDRFKPTSAPTTDNQFSSHEDSEEIDDGVVYVLPKHIMSSDKSMWFNTLINSTAEVDNVWIATIVGELAELVIYQGLDVGTNMTLGSAGFWNNTMRPQIFYLIQENDEFEFTRAEIVGSVDGFIIAKKLKMWRSYIDNLRLSQIFDMYYSSQGIVFDSVSACDRKKTFWYVASRTDMEDQAYGISQILAYRQSHAYITDDALKNLVASATEKFTNYVNNHLFPEHRCRKEQLNPRVEVIVVFNSDSSQEPTANFFARLLEDMNVSKFGSKIGILHGTTGEWLLNITDSPSSVYEKFINQLHSISWPTHLNFIKNINKINQHLTEKWKEKQNKHLIGSLGQTVIFLAPRGVNEIENKDEIIASLNEFKKSHPDVHLLYYTTQTYFQSFKSFLISEEDYLIDISKTDDINSKLLKTPRSLRPALCNRNVTHGVRDQVEDYVQPQDTINYKLDPLWRRKTKNVNVTIAAVDYGTLEICSWSQMKHSIVKMNYKCRELSGHSETEFVDFFICKKDANCPAIFYQIRGLHSATRCAEIECKSPNYIRFILRLENLQCSSAILLLPNLFITLSLFIHILFIQ